MSRSIIRRIANRPKTALVGSALVLSSAAMVLGANPASAAAAPSQTGSAKAIAQQMIKDDAQFECFSNIVSHESGWDAGASNPSSGAYGLVQALPGSKMASAGADWKTNPKTQIKWGLDYMNDRYGSPCGAWSAWQSQGWY
ncbi:transglycosylase SLT domain-containing protein [Streptomyces sp. NBC_00879]|uniref:aggregation-promoting factor C-terminal-like domain-containing protein n=1 Tax=unclassified Streptomyces TaxID=2593676 RepID=UPI002D7804C8|nr:transglycosylase SLT domain-containing protein [Streptomyces sp.]WSY77404.1 transglycosylase SLT domain-containing protein [Streptomyces sp. NBC_00879]HET6359282.1 transglycosylase SLT domain-containing protein [Streptomyces sp.]